MISNFNIFLHCVQPPLSQVASYNFSCASTDGEGNCSELLPANTTSFTLSVAAGIQYTIMVSALIGDRESQDNPQLNLGKLNEITMSEFISYIYMHRGFPSSISKCLVPHSKELTATISRCRNRELFFAYTLCKQCSSFLTAWWLLHL